MAAKCDSKDDSLTAVCSVCGSPAAAHLHYGAVSCYSCRAFFRRGQPKQIRCIFGHGSCQISPHNRTNCKLCRYNRCLEVGMKPDKVDRFVAKKKEREANMASTEDAQLLLNIQEPNRCPSSEDIPQVICPSTSTTLDEGPKKQTGKTEELPKTKNMELNTFCDNMIGLFRNMKDNQNASNERNNQNNFTELLDLRTKEKHPAANINNSLCNSVTALLENNKEVGLQEKRTLFHPVEEDNTHNYTWNTHNYTHKTHNYATNTHNYTPNTHGNTHNIHNYTHNTHANTHNTHANTHNTHGNTHKTTQHTSWNKTRQTQPCSTVISQQDSARNNTHEMYRYTMPGRSVNSLQDGLGAGGWLSGKVQGNQDFSETLRKQENKTSVITRNHYSNTLHYMERMSEPEVKIEDVKEEIDDISYKSSSPNREQYFRNPINVFSHEHSNESFYSKVSVLKRKHLDMNTAYLAGHQVPAQIFQPYRSVIQKIIKHPDQQLSARHTVTDFKDAAIPRPLGIYKGDECQKNYKTEAESAEKSEEVDKGDKDVENSENVVKAIIVGNTANEETSTNKSEDERDSHSSNEKSLFPLKKRQRMMEIAYDTGHGINKKVLPVMSFTFEEEFRVMDYIVRIEDYQNRRFDFLNQNFPRYKELTLGFVSCTKRGLKIPYNKVLEEKLFSIGLEFTKQTSKEVFDEMGILNQEERMDVIKSTYPALYVVMWAILEGNTREKTWMDQHMKTLHITKENHAAIKDNIHGLENVRSISLKDQERFTSPWALETTEEEKFERTVSLVGRLLRDDIQLQALYHMLVMMKPAEKHSPKYQPDPTLVSVQSSLCQFIYRYLAAKDNTDLKYTKTVKTDTSLPEPGTSCSSSIMKKSEDMDDLDPAAKTSLLISLVEDVHDCVDIMQNRSLMVQREDLKPQ